MQGDLEDYSFFFLISRNYMLLKQEISKNSVVSSILFWPGDEYIYKWVSQTSAS